MKSKWVLAQLTNVGDPAENLEKAKKYAKQAYEEYHPDFMIFPEVYMTHYPQGTPMETVLAAAQPLDGPFVTGMRELAKKYHMWMVFGMSEPAGDRKTNTTVMLNSDGEIVSSYRKTHLYDAFGYFESATTCPGDKFFEPVDTPFGKLGMFVCYEVRFPEVSRYQRMKGAEILLMPTAWAEGRLKSQQFHTLINARAIENGCFVVACDLCSEGSMGESVVVDPMGVNIAAAGEREQLLFAEIDTDRVPEVRRKVPSYDQRRPDLYCN